MHSVHGDNLLTAGGQPVVHRPSPRTAPPSTGVTGRQATVRIDRPEVHNALDRPTLDALADAFARAAVDDRVGVVVLTGTGDLAFSTGADLAEQAAFLERPNDYWAWMGHFIAAIDAIRTCPKPVVARLNGMTVGGTQA